MARDLLFAATLRFLCLSEPKIHRPLQSPKELISARILVFMLSYNPMNTTSPIVICDQDQQSREKLNNILVSAGFSCIVLNEGAKVVEAIRESDAFIVIVDMLLPDMDGSEVVKSLRASEMTLGKSAFVIALASDREMAERFMDAGGDAVFNKPFNPQKLVVAVQRACHRRNSAKEQPGQAAGVPFEQSVMLQTTPPASGVVIVRDGASKAIVVEWAQNIRQRLQTYLAGQNEISQQVAACAKSADFLITDDEKVAGAVFDHEVTVLDDFPRFTQNPPAGSCHEGLDNESILYTDHAISLDRPIDPLELKEAKRQLDENPQDLQAKDWYAFLCYRYGHHEESIQHFAELVDGGSEKPEHFFYLGCALAAVANYEIALEMWQKVTAREPESRLARKCQRRIDEIKAQMATAPLSE